MAQYVVFSALVQFFTFFSSDFHLFRPEYPEETEVVEMLIWCIKIGIVLVLHIKGTLTIPKSKSSRLTLKSIEIFAFCDAIPCN
jgi:hypothetical protein